jgi:hypothetical protein
MFRRIAGLGLLAATVQAAELKAQGDENTVSSFRTGPRFGVTWLGGSVADTINRRYRTNITNVISQFGWQYEKQFASLEGGPVALNEIILLFGGLDQGVAIPTLTWLVGVRTPGEFEFGVGPIGSPAGVALAVAVGQTFKAGALRVPVNFSWVPSRFGSRVGILSGFNVQRMRRIN